MELEVRALGDDLLAQLSQLPESLPSCTVSIGALENVQLEPEAIRLGLKQADLALYEAKAQGRGRLVMATLPVCNVKGDTSCTISAE